MQLSNFYGKNFNQDYEAKRFASLKHSFILGENESPDYFFSSSGRAEILGNHTDHNHGKVIVSAISCDILACVKRTDSNIIKIQSDGYPVFSMDIADLKLNKKEYGSSLALTRGVVKAIIDKGYKNVSGFTAYITSDVFKGAGVSSSAAFELLICEIINVLFLDGKLTKVEKALISQYSENIYFGKPCGLLDQSGISLGGLSMLDFQNPSSPIIEQLPLFDGYSIIITNTGGDHTNLTKHYASIKNEMIGVAKVFGKQYLRDVDEKLFYSAIASLKNQVSDRAILRAYHFFEENHRVELAGESLKNNDIHTFLKCVNESGLSSLNYLQNCFVPNSTSQNIPLALKISSNFIKDGAVRIHGGGFAGTIIAFVSENETAEYVKLMKNIFGNDHVFSAEVRPFGAAQII